MRLINKESITRVVDECYSSKYKIFSINSIDGISLSESIGLFISLGISTSMKTLRSVSDFINESLGIKSSISEIESRLILGRYLNRISETDPVKVHQYKSDFLVPGDDDIIIDNDDGLENLVTSLKSKLLTSVSNDEVLKYSYRLTRVHKIVKKIKSLDTFNWDDYKIDVINNESDFNISIVSNNINYMKVNENYNGEDIVVHKRIGILVKF